jgi:hypothetical protein
MASQQGKIILYLIILLGLVGGYMYNAQFDPTEVVPEFPLGINQSALTSLGNLKVDYRVLQNPDFETLRIFGSFPVPTSAPGKNNPFR